VYNICYGAGGLARPSTSPMSALNSLVEDEALQAAIQRWTSVSDEKDSEEDRSILLFVLQHKYTEATLKPTSLKGVDRTHASTLAQLAKRNNLEVLLVNISKHEMGSYDCDELPRTKKELESVTYEPPDSSQYEATNIIPLLLESDQAKIGQSAASEDSGSSASAADFLLTAADWYPLVYDKPKEFTLSTSSAVVVPDDALQQCDREEMHATGNEGTEVERWYTGAAVMLFPRTRSIKLLHTVPHAKTLYAQAFPSLLQQWTAAQHRPTQMQTAVLPSSCEVRASIPASASTEITVNIIC